jgi:hypothetical protein
MTGLRHFVHTLAIAAGGLAVLLPLAGCSQFTYVPVKGKVVLKNKQPMTVGVVVFYPDKDNPLRQIPRGTINPDGTYELNTEGHSGVPIGSYIACVRAPNRRINGKDPPPLSVPAKFLNADDSPLKIQVVANPAPGAYDLDLGGN